jgi:hypothetical protein
MHCKPFAFTMPDGQPRSGFACSRGSSKRCKCGRKATKACDHKLTGRLNGKTCSAPLCDRCSTSTGEDLDLCPVHARMAQKDSVDHE